MNNTVRKLPDSELEVMLALWECEIPASREDIENILFIEHRMAMTTLLTLLTRLNEKGFIKIEKNGRKSYYIPLISKEEYLSFSGKNFFSKLCKSDVSLFANALCDSGLTKEELHELRLLLERNEI